MNNDQLRFFSGKLVISLATIFTMEKSPIQNSILAYVLICQSIFKIFAALLNTFGMQNGDII